MIKSPQQFCDAVFRHNGLNDDLIFNASPLLHMKNPHSLTVIDDLKQLVLEPADPSVKQR